MSSSAPSDRAGTSRARQLGAIALREVIPRRGMPLRRRVSMAAAAAVAIAVALAVVVCYVAVSYRVHSELNNELKAEGLHYRELYSSSGQTGSSTMPTIGQYEAYRGGSSPYREVVTADGAGYTAANSSGLQILKGATAVAAGTKAAFLQDVMIGSTDVCIYTLRFATGTTANGTTEGVAVELGRPLTQSNSLLHELRLILLVVFLFAVPLAALFGRFAARRVLKPLSKVTATADTIARTDDLSQRIDVQDDDEVGQLASRFNAMLERLGASRAELDDSVRSQRQLVADASHELRTPVTSLRTNVEVLLASPDLDEGDRLLLEDVLEQSEELSTLVSDLIEVARGELSSDSLDDVRLDDLVESALIRARRNAPNTDFRAELEPAVVQGSPELLARAVNNLLDNAVKHGGNGPVDIQVDAHGLKVRDHGQGIDPGDLPHIFDRFYRGVDSRSTQGSGLGLAIVAHTAGLHGGAARAANAPDGGAIFTLELPTTPPAGTEGHEPVEDAGEGSAPRAGALWS